MKKRSIITVILFFIMLFLIFIVFLALKTNPEQKRFKLFNFNPGELVSFSLSKKRVNATISDEVISDSLYIEKIGTEWYITYPHKRIVNKEKINFFLNTFLHIQRFGKILTTNPYNYDYYKVSEKTGSRVVLYDQNNEVLDDVFFGFADLTPYGSARRNYEDVVYEISQNVSSDVSPNLKLWRENSLIYFDKTKTDSIKVSFSASRYSLINDNNQWFYKDEEHYFPLNNAHKAFTNVMMQLDNMKTYNFLDNLWDEYKGYFSKSILDLKIYKKDHTYDHIVFVRYTDELCLIQVNDKKNELYLGNYGMINRFTKSPESYLDVMRFTY